MDQNTRRFIEFIELDARLDRLIQEHEAQKKREEGLQQEIAAIAQESETALKKTNALKKQLDALELDLKVIADKYRQTTAKLNRAASPKEFFSLEHEVQDLEKKKAPLEEQGLVLLLEVENAQDAYELIKAQEPEKLAALQERRAALGKDIAFSADLIKAYQVQREQEEKGLAPDLLENYQRMKERVTNPVVPLLKNSCSACFYAVNQPGIIEISHGKLVSCRDCYRLLYSPQLESNHDKED